MNIGSGIITTKDAWKPVIVPTVETAGTKEQLRPGAEAGGGQPHGPQPGP